MSDEKLVLKGKSATHTPEERQNWTDKTIRNYAFGSVITGFIPLPLVDFAALAGIQLKLISKLSEYYGVEFSQEMTKNIIASLTGAAVPFGLTRVVCSFCRFVPFVGLAVSLASLSVFSAASTYALGKLFVKHFESGGTFLDFDIQKAKDYYDEQVKKGKEIAESYFCSKSQ